MKCVNIKCKECGTVTFHRIEKRKNPKVFDLAICIVCNDWYYYGEFNPPLEVEVEGES